MPTSRTIRLGNAGGFWGDDPDALSRQISSGPLDYISVDFLAEITMSILQKQRSRNPEKGYAADFIDQMDRCFPLLKDRRLTIISNAGGINPTGCAEEVGRSARRHGIDTEIAVVEGDDLMPRLDELLAQGHSLSNMETGAPLRGILDRVESANVYLGAAPVIKALRLGARIVVTGRVTDTGITVAAPSFEYGWAVDDWDRTASAVVAAHIIECGAQASGGNLTDWRTVPSFQDMGYPIVEFSPEGPFVVTKHDANGGLVNRQTVSEQLVYEMGDPRRYFTPDVVADFSAVRLREDGPNRVRVEGARGKPPTDTLKISISYRDGYKALGTVIVSRPDAVEKCRKAAEVFWRRLGIEFEERRINLVGYDSCHGHLAPPVDPPEVLLMMAVRDPDRAKVAEFSKKFPSIILSTVPGIAIVGARPRIQDVVAYWPCLLPASEVEPTVSLLGVREVHSIRWSPPAPGVPADSEAEPQPESRSAETERPSPEETVVVPLIDLAYARSGDKGNTCNVGVVARSPEIFTWLRAFLTAERVKGHFGNICRGEVERFEAPHLLALNFLLHESLGGGGTVSLGIDPQGKTYSAALLMMDVEAPLGLLGTVGGDQIG